MLIYIQIGSLWYRSNPGEHALIIGFIMITVPVFCRCHGSAKRIGFIMNPINIHDKDKAMSTLDKLLYMTKITR